MNNLRLTEVRQKLGFIGARHIAENPLNETTAPVSAMRLLGRELELINSDELELINSVEVEQRGAEREDLSWASCRRRCRLCVALYRVRGRAGVVDYQPGVAGAGAAATCNFTA